MFKWSLWADCVLTLGGAFLEHVLYLFVGEKIIARNLHVYSGKDFILLRQLSQQVGIDDLKSKCFKAGHNEMKPALCRSIFLCQDYI